MVLSAIIFKGLGRRNDLYIFFRLSLIFIKADKILINQGGDFSNGFLEKYYLDF